MSRENELRELRVDKPDRSPPCERAADGGAAGDRARDEVSNSIRSLLLPGARTVAVGLAGARDRARHNAGGYFAFARPLRRLYLVYENWLARTNRRNLATHYVIVGVR